MFVNVYMFTSILGTWHIPVGLLSLNVAVCILCLYYIHFALSKLWWPYKPEPGHKNFHFIITLFRLFRRNTIWQYYITCLLVTLGPEVGNINPCIYASVVRDAKRVSQKNPPESVVQKKKWLESEMLSESADVPEVRVICQDLVNKNLRWTLGKGILSKQGPRRHTILTLRTSRVLH